ncbi:hypothetical protein BS50DRAFT_217824 [Corynespora cassiicola Philippines]|uniref:Uncharacterized protein n=1 Tax=Corynespora cassiicola Philippines TaxID=1448308 RepID=A0A2T2N465_CORCC|nr:hypothetical protein BS50DRAFT_217824 [Corynespora cassiicola Philippines]
MEGKLVEKTNELSSKETKMKEQIRLADEFMEKVKSTRTLLEENEKLLAVRNTNIENREKHCDDEQQRMAVQGRGLNEKEQWLVEWQERLDIRSREQASREQRSWTAQNTPSPLQPGVNTSTSNKMVTFIKYAPARQQFIVQGGSKIKDGSDVNDFDIQLLRIHDYYKGWLDGIKSVEAEEACRQHQVNQHKTREVYRENNPFGQYNAGFHVGMYFNWSQACHAQGKSQWATCLDQRQWRASDLVPDYHQVAHTFWEGVRQGKQSAWAKFQQELRKERGN